MEIREVFLDDNLLEKLIALSKIWESEDSCYGYRANTREDIEGNRVFIAEDDGEILGYLFGKVTKAEFTKSIMDKDTPFFEIEEAYVVPERRSQGIGSSLFKYAEEIVKKEGIGYILLSTATKNWKAIFHFYLDQMDMTFWSSTLFKKL